MEKYKKWKLKNNLLNRLDYKAPKKNKSKQDKLL